MRKSIIFALMLFLSAGSFLASAQRFDISTEERVFTEQEKALIEHCKAAEKKYAELEPSGTFQEGDFGSGLVVRNWKERLSPEKRENWEKGLAEARAMMQSDIPTAYAWLLPEGKRAGDKILDEKGEFSLFLSDRTAADYNAMVSRVTARGYKVNAEKTAFGGITAYEAANAAGEKCAVMLMNGDLMVNFSR